MKIRTWLPNVVESVVIFAGGAANALLSMKGFSWAAVVITSALVVGESFMSLDQTYEKTQELDKKLTTNGGQKLTVLERVWYWIAPSIGLGLTVCLLPVYGYYNIAVPDLKWWINIPIAGGATIILPCIRKIVDWRLRKRIETIEVQPDPRIGELRAEITGLKWDFVVSKREELNGLAEQQRQEIEDLRTTHTVALAGLKDEYRKAMHDIKYKYSENMEKKEEDYSRRLADFEMQHTEMIEEKQIEFDEICENLKRRHQEAISAIENERNEEIREAKEAHLKEISDLEVQHQKRISELTETIERKQQEINDTKEANQQMVEQLMTVNRQVSDEKEILQQTTEEQARQLSRLHGIILPTVLSTSRYGTFSHAELPLMIEEGNLQGHTRRRSISLGGLR